MPILFYLALPNDKYVHSFGARTKAIARTTSLESALSFKSEKAANNWLNKYKPRVILNQLKDVQVVVLGEADGVAEETAVATVATALADAFGLTDSPAVIVTE